MKRKYNIVVIAVILFIITILVWYLFYPFSSMFWSCQHKNTAYVAAGALFTALAFLGTVVTVLYQYKTELQKTSLGIYQIIYSGMMADPKFNNAIKYLNENKNQQKTKSQLMHERVEFLQNIEISSTPTGTIVKKTFTEDNQYKILMYFCEKMEYLGILIKENNLDISLFYSNGETITNAFDVMKEWAFFEGHDSRKYIHFRYLVHRIKKEKNRYHKHCKSIERKIRLDEWKTKIKDLFCCIFGIGF